MTNEEAISNLKELKGDVKVHTLPHIADIINESLGMAINALEQHTCEDCISRKEALKVMCDNCPMYNCVTGCSSYRHIEKMPPVTPKTDVLDEVRAEIKELRYGQPFRKFVVDECLEIIDKYKVESEEV